ncbi:MAG: DUF6935 domain-containing protein [Lachnospiraceae bacterium]
MANVKTFSFKTLPADCEELTKWPGFDLGDPYCVAAMAVAALCIYPSDRNAAVEMLNHLKGPEKLSESQKQFIRDRFMDGKDYVPRSYFAGAVPGNDYQPDLPYTISVSDNPYSDENEGYKKLFVTSGGADSPRAIVLRCKPSTGEWFLWEFSGILSGIRIPESSDPWA